MALCRYIITAHPTNPQTCDDPAAWLALVPEKPLSVKCVWQHRCDHHLTGATAKVKLVEP